MGPGFDMVPGVLGGLSASLLDIGIADLGKRSRPAAFEVDFACKTAQKSPAGSRVQGKARFTVNQVAGEAVRNLLDTRLMSGRLYP